ncbi:hypothetical protein E2C01_009230 [Portunus trituberculatus]|uniref:Uncharacterized protein n=1 Tax=Portunus trituberculatus TaxID=210409 RepID=A0A5B7D4T7_PORTR|nr:hypothetical protein [Portunus trituberculatus]
MMVIKVASRGLAGTLWCWGWWKGWFMAPSAVTDHRCNNGTAFLLDSLSSCLMTPFCNDNNQLQILQGYTVDSNLTLDSDCCLQCHNTSPLTQTTSASLLSP